MKRTLSLVALSVAATMAAPIKYGANVEGIFAMPSMDSDILDPTYGFGGNVGAGARFTIMDNLSVRPVVGFEYVTGAGADGSMMGMDMTVTYSAMFLTLGTSIEYNVLPNLFVALTPEFDLSLGGTAKTEMSGTVLGLMPVDISTEEDIKDEGNPFLIGIGAGYQLNENIAISAGYKLALTNYMDKVEDVDEEDGSKSTILKDMKVSKIYVGARYEL